MQKNCARKKCRNTQRGQEHCAKSKSALTITAPTLPSLRLDRKGRRKGIYKKISKYEKTRGRKLHETVLFEIKGPGVDFFLRF